MQLAALPGTRLMKWQISSPPEFADSRVPRTADRCNRRFSVLSAIDQVLGLRFWKLDCKFAGSSARTMAIGHGKLFAAVADEVAVGFQQRRGPVIFDLRQRAATGVPYFSTRLMAEWGAAGWWGRFPQMVQ